MSIGDRVHAIRVASKREIKSTLYGIGIYMTLFLVFLGSSVPFAATSLRNVLTEGMWVFVNPISTPFYYSVILAAMYLGLCASLSISRDRDLGTLEVLFYGPVDVVSYIGAKFVHLILAFIVVLAFSVVNFLLVSQLTNFGFTADFFWFLVLSLFLMSCMASFGILLSALTRRMMASVIAFLGIVLFLLGFNLAHAFIMGMTAVTPFLVYVRMILDNMKVVIDWISPIAYFGRGFAAVAARDATQFAISIVSSIVYSGLLLWASVWFFKKQGVRR